MPDLVFVAASIILSRHLTKEFAIVILLLHDFQCRTGYDNFTYREF